MRPSSLGLTCPAPCQRRHVGVPACREEIAIAIIMHGAAEYCYLTRQCLCEGCTDGQTCLPSSVLAPLVSPVPIISLRGHCCKVFDMQPGQWTAPLWYPGMFAEDMMDRPRSITSGSWVAGVPGNVKLGVNFGIDDLFAEGFDAVFPGHRLLDQSMELASPV